MREPHEPPPILGFQNEVSFSKPGTDIFNGWNENEHDTNMQTLRIVLNTCRKPLRKDARSNLELYYEVSLSDVGNVSMK